MHPVGTKENTADIGTKPLSAKRIRLLLHWLGFQTSENEPVELKEHKAQTQAKAAVRMIKSQGSLSFAALLFAGISVISEELQFQESFQELQEESFRREFQELQEQCFGDFQEPSFSMSAYAQEQSCLNMSACAVGSESMCEGTYAEMLSQLKGLTSSLLSRQGVALGTTVPSTAPMSGETASSSKSIKEQREEMSKVREALERNTEQMSLLLSSHSKLNATVQEMSSETKSLRWTVQELQEEADRHKTDTEIRLNEFTSVMSNLSEKFEEVLEDLCEQRTSEGELATEEQRKRDDEEREEYLRNRKEEAEHRREGHLRGTTSRTTSPTRRKAGKEEEEEFSDKGCFEKILEQEQEYEDYMGNVNEMYTQSYTGPTEDEYPEEGRGRRRKGGTQRKRRRTVRKNRRRKERGRSRRSTRRTRKERRKRKRRWKDSSSPATTATSGRSTAKEDKSTGSTE